MLIRDLIQDLDAAWLARALVPADRKPAPPPPGEAGTRRPCRWESLHGQGRRGRLTIRDRPGWFSRLFR